MSTIQNNPEPYHLFGFDLELNRFGAIALILTVVGCMGGLVQWSGGMAHTSQLILSVFPTMLVLSLILAVQPMKRVVWAAAAAIIVDVSIILYNVL